MPGRGGKGKSSKKGGSKKGESSARTRELVLKTEDQVYGKALKLLGEGRVSVMCDDNVKRTCLICGRMRNRVYVRVQDVVLVALRTGMTDDSRADIVHKYTSDEARSINKRGELPDKFLVEMTEETAIAAVSASAASHDDEVIMFEDADIDAI